MYNVVCSVQPGLVEFEGEKALTADAFLAANAYY